MHHKAVLGSDVEESMLMCQHLQAEVPLQLGNPQWYLSHPDREGATIKRTQLARNRSNVMDQMEILEGIIGERNRWEEM